MAMDAIFSWFQRVEKVQFMAIDGRALTFKSKKTFRVGSRPTISIELPVSDEAVQSFRLPVTITKVRQVGPKAVVCTGDVPGAAKNIEHLRQILQGLDPNAAGSSAGAIDDEDAMRRAPRYNWSIRVLSKDLPGFRAISLDFNRLGVKLSTEGHVEENKPISMMLEIETTETREVLCQGVVRWSREVGRRKYEIGVEFSELDEVVARELHNFESFLATRTMGDVAKRSITDNVLFEDPAFGPGVEKMNPRPPGAYGEEDGDGESDPSDTDTPDGNDGPKGNNKPGGSGTGPGRSIPLQ